MSPHLVRGTHPRRALRGLQEGSGKAPRRRQERGLADTLFCRRCRGSGRGRQSAPGTGGGRRAESRAAPARSFREGSETVPRRLREGVSRKTRAERGGTPAAAPCTAGACRPACLQGPEQVHSAAVPRSAPARSLASQPPRRRSPAESEARCGGVALPPPLPLLLPRGAVSLRRGRPPDTDSHRSREELPRSARSEVRTPSALASRGGGPRPRART